ncbi:MAG: ABC transporter ATP-binding protein [Burkholderiaceae bacterium]|nr:ABC transporter ATP-binding protein [Burkholderiaceae bacterium]
MTTRSIPDDPLLSVEDVELRFGGIVALDGVTFVVQRGIVCGLIGPNGAGKTTLFNCLSRLYELDAGRIVFDGVDLGALPRHRVAALGIGRTFQDLALFGSMSVLDNVLVGTHARTRSGFLANALRLPGVAAEERAAEERAAQRLGLLGLDAVMHVRVAELPFATRKRVELARALAAEPRLLLLDEPASGLDHGEIEALAGSIRALRDRLGLTIVLVEHRMKLVMDVCDKVVALNFGRKIAEGRPDRVRVHPEVVEAYLGTGTN